MPPSHTLLGSTAKPLSSSCKQSVSEENQERAQGYPERPVRISHSPVRAAISWPAHAHCEEHTISARRETLCAMCDSPASVPSRTATLAPPPLPVPSRSSFASPLLPAPARGGIPWSMLKSFGASLLLAPPPIPRASVCSASAHPSAPSYHAARPCDTSITPGLSSYCVLCRDVELKAH